MDLFLWKGYEVYFFDEDNGTDYVGDFMEKLAVEDVDKAYDILRSFLERLEKGIGLPIEWQKGNKKLKDLGKKVKKNKGLWEYRDRSNKTKRLIRIYFGVEKGNKRIVLLDAHFKENKKEQERKLRTVRERWKRYKGEV